MLRLNEVRQRLKDRNLKEVARQIDVPYDTVRRIAIGKFTNPSYFAVEKLSDYLTKEIEDK